MQFIKQIYKKDNESSKITVFIDRDGTIIKEVSYLSSPKQIEFIPGVIDEIKKLNEHGVIIIVVTNQPVVARGLISVKELENINYTLAEVLNKNGVYINAIYSCPHHPERNHADIPPHAMKYRVDCECRKPKIAMLKKATKDFNINLRSTYIVGDRTSDIKTGENFGIKTILLETGFGGRDHKYSTAPNYICKNFSEAVDIIINN